MQSIKTSRLTIGAKLYIAFAGLLAIAVVFSAAWLWSLNSLDKELVKASTVTARKLKIVGQIEVSATRLRTGQRGVILYAMTREPERVEAAKADFQKHYENIRERVSELRPLLETEAGRQATSVLEEKSAAWQQDFGRIVERCEERDFGPNLKALVDRTFGHADPMDAAAAKLIELQDGLLAEGVEHGESLVDKNRYAAFTLMALALAIGILVFLMVRAMSRHLRVFASDLGVSAQQVASASGQIASSSQSLAQGSSEQAAAVEETSASVEEIHSMTRKNAENAEFAVTVAVEAAGRVEAANRTLGEMVQSMKEINSSSDKISRIIKVIDEIAFQTNLLALNAAVEAARAGTAGMGFAVVADEVRQLAQRSAQAAKDTTALIEESIATSTQGSSRLSGVVSAIHAITEQTSRMRELVEEVNLGSQEQSRGIEQITKAVAQIEQVTQRAAADAEESAAAGEEMSAQAESMRDLADQLLDIVGRDGAASTSGRDDRHQPVHGRKTAAALANEGPVPTGRSRTVRSIRD
jgi:methyl-accepting chemotaxis protein